MEKTKQYMGTKKFFGYSARDNNCQDFLLSVFKANNIPSIVRRKINKVEFYYINNMVSNNASVHGLGRGWPKNICDLHYHFFNGFYYYYNKR
jgi:hypothetical protein